MYIYVYNVYTYRERSYVTVASLASDKSKIQKCLLAHSG